MFNLKKYLLIAGMLPRSIHCSFRPSRLLFRVFLSASIALSPVAYANSGIVCSANYEKQMNFREFVSLVANTSSTFFASLSRTASQIASSLRPMRIVYTIDEVTGERVPMLELDEESGSMVKAKVPIPLKDLHPLSNTFWADFVGGYIKSTSGYVSGAFAVVAIVSAVATGVSLPIALGFGLGAAASYKATMLLIKVIGDSVDTIIESLGTVFAASTVAIITAMSTNIPELAAAMGSLFGLDPTAIVANAPLGSNFYANPVLLAGAFVLAIAFYAGKKNEAALAEFAQTIKSAVSSSDIDVRNHARSEVVKMLGQLGPKKIIGAFRAFTTDAKNFLSNQDLRDSKPELVYLGAMGAVAGLFALWVGPEMSRGNLVPFFGWFTLASIGTISYIRFYSSPARVISRRYDAFMEIENSEFGTFSNKIEAMLPVYQSTKPQIVAGLANTKKMIDLMGVHMEMLSQDTPNQDELKTIALEIQKVAREIKKDKKNLKVLREILTVAASESGAHGIEQLLVFAKLDLVSSESTQDKWARLATVAGSVLAAGSMLALAAITLDPTVNLMVNSLVFIDKAFASMFIVSIFTSVGEFASSKNYIEQLKGTLAIRNMTVSGISNLAIAAGVVALSFVTVGIIF